MTALLLVDLQNDFMPGGALGIEQGLEILPIVNQLVSKTFDVIVATQDWHPPTHQSFATVHGKQPGEHTVLKGIDQILWPAHCVQGTSGAAFAEWNHYKINHIIYKGTDPEIDSYSAFFDNARLKSTHLYEYLQEKKISALYVAGVATEYCIKYTVLDALELGFKVYVIQDTCRAINLSPDDEAQAFLEMKRAGAHLITHNEI
ncbi:MAG: bifunctional nicotinamidase/pyrazinamidase [Parachlamydiaceae bacterium]